ncbi:MAG: PEP-CTERM sorting domain-containing protein [Phycisphaeraceae bacterium]
MKRSLFAITLLAATGTAVQASTVVAYDNFGGDNLNLTSLAGEESYSSGGDGFQAYDGSVPDSAPFALIDASNGTFPGDSLGILIDDANGNYNSAFGAVDVINGDNPDSIGTAVWTFDFPLSPDLDISFDFAAMGDFESSNDAYTITIEVDGNNVATFTTSVDENADQDYTLADGSVQTLNDPLLLDGTVLSNAFTTFSTGNVGPGSQVVLTLSGATDGGSEAVALDNITVTSIPEPTSLALLGLGGLLVARRRRG